MDEIKIPKATARRLPLYYRYLIFLNDEGKEKVSSTELAEAVQVDSASIRRDFSYLVLWVSVAMAMMLRTCLISLKRF